MRKRCPFRQLVTLNQPKSCMREECMLWDDIGGQCALLTLAFAMTDLDISVRRFFGFDEEEEDE